MNGLNEAWETKNVGGLNLKSLSRRFDIEFRTQYFYAYDVSTETCTELKLQVPMLFVQDEFYDSLTKDVKDKNPDVNIGISISSDNLQKVRDDYQNLVPKFENNKKAMTSQVIIDIIGQKVMFD